MKQKVLSLTCSLLLIVMTLPIQGCSSLATVQKAQNVIEAAINIASAETAVIPPADLPAYNNYIALAKTLDAQLNTCVVGVSTIMGKSGKFAACFTAFATGLTNPAELAQLRILNPSTQSKVQLYLTAVVVGVNLIIAFTSPVIAPTPTPVSELRDLGHRMGYSDAELRTVGL